MSTTDPTTSLAESNNESSIHTERVVGTDGDELGTYGSQKGAPNPEPNNLHAALLYAELGYRVFPCVVGDKTPACEHGFKDATTDESQIDQWWTDNPNANIGLATEGLLVLDIDGERNAWYDGLSEEQREPLMACPAAHTPSGGSHFYFKQPAGEAFACTTATIAPKVDTRANGGYVVAAPSILEGGGGYRWYDEREIESRASLQEPPAFVLELLASNKSKPGERREVSTPGKAIVESFRNDTLTRIAGTMRRYGVSQDAIDAALQVTNCDQCQPPLDPSEVSKIAASVAKYQPHLVASARIHGTEDEIRLSVDGSDQVETDAPFPQHLLDVPGLIGDVVNYTLDTAHRKQPVLSLAGAIALMSVITGRKVMTDSGMRGNLMLIALAESAMGKDHPREVNKQLLAMAGLEHMIGPESSASATGLFNCFTDGNQALLLQWDEIGRMLKTMSDRRASPHLTEVITVLMKLYTSSSTLCKGHAYADKTRNTVIDQPHAVLYGTATRKQWYDALTGDLAVDGFVGRLLAFEGDDQASLEPTKPIAPVPASLVEQVKWWGNPPFGDGNLSSSMPNPRSIPWSQDGLAYHEDRRHERYESLANQEGSLASAWRRCSEKAEKFALLHACSVKAATIDLDAAKWGHELAEYLVQRLEQNCRKHVADSLHERNCKEVLNWAIDWKKKHKLWPTKTDVTRNSPMRKHDSRHRAEIEKSLEDIYRAKWVTEDTGKSGPNPERLTVV